MSETEYAERFLKKTESLFLSKLIFWVKHPKHYGTFEDGRWWIYNTLDEWAEQLNVSKRTVERAINRLCELKFVDKKYLNPNRRNRTLYYSVNFNVIQKAIESKTYKSNTCGNMTGHMDGHMDGHMYTVNNKQNNKSDKSNKSAEEVSGISGVAASSGTKPTIVQAMVKIWKDEFPSNTVVLNRKLCSYLVKIFKDKFNSSLSEWKKYLKLIKTSAWLMSEKFRMSLFWVTKFETVQRLLGGEFGVSADRISPDESEITEKAEEHADFAEETEGCREVRRKIIGKYGAAVYNSWFAKIPLREEDGIITAEYPNDFVKDYVKNNFTEFFFAEESPAIEKESKNEKITANRIRAKNTDRSCSFNYIFSHIYDFEGISAAINNTENKFNTIGCGFFGKNTGFCGG